MLCLPVVWGHATLLRRGWILWWNRRSVHEENDLATTIMHMHMEVNTHAYTSSRYIQGQHRHAWHRYLHTTSWRLCTRLRLRRAVWKNTENGILFTVCRWGPSHVRYLNPMVMGTFFFCCDLLFLHRKMIATNHVGCPILLLISI